LCGCERGSTGDDVDYNNSGDRRRHLSVGGTRSQMAHRFIGCGELTGRRRAQGTRGLSKLVVREGDRPTLRHYLGSPGYEEQESGRRANGHGQGSKQSRMGDGAIIIQDLHLPGSQSGIKSVTESLKSFTSLPGWIQMIGI